MIVENEDEIKVDAAALRGPSANDPLGERLSLSFRIKGTETIILNDPGVGHDFSAAVRGTFGFEQQKVIAKGVAEFADRVYALIYQAGAKVAHGRELSDSPEHPSAALRRDIAGLEAQIADLQSQLTVAKTQRDELRRLFVEPVTITGVEDSATYPLSQKEMLAELAVRRQRERERRSAES